MVRLLLEKEAAVDTKNGERRTALHKAARNGHESVVQLLLEKEAAVNGRNQRGWTALHYAALGGTGR